MSRPRGFTLIEVMVTVAIVAILAAIAVPSYSEYIRRSRITEGVAVLSDMRNKMEQYFQDNRSWSPPAPALPPCSNGTVAPLPAATPSFTYTCTNLGPNTYTVTATGNAGSTVAGLTYSINQANVRTTDTVPAGWTPPAPNNCWALKRDGSC